MNRIAVISVAVIALVLTGVLVFYFVGMGGWEDLQGKEPPPADYKIAKDADEIISLEYLRFMQMQRSGERYRLPSRAQHVLDNIHTVKNEQEFRVLVVQQLYEALAAHAEQFKEDHPDIWKAATAPSAGDGRKLCSKTVAALPHALYPEPNLEDIEACLFVARVKLQHGDDFRDVSKPPLTIDDIAGEQEVTEFLKATEVLATRLEAALAKERVYYPTKPYFDPEEALEFPWPVGWDAMMQLRIQVLALRGEHDKARREIFAVLELLERTEATKSLFGTLFQIVMVDRYISKIVVPCTCAGALSAEDLEEIARRGSAIAFDVGNGVANELVYRILQYLAPTWKRTPGAGTAGIPNLLVSILGKDGIDAWLERLDTDYPAWIDAFEAELPALYGDEHVIHNEADFRRCVDLWQRILVPFVGSEAEMNLPDIYVSQLRWTELAVRVREMRERKLLKDWDDPLAPFRNLPGLKPKLTEEGVELFLDANYMKSLGIETSRERPEFVVRFVEYDNWD